MTTAKAKPNPKSAKFPSSPVIRWIAFHKIRADQESQPRAGIDDATVARYAELIRDGQKLDPMVVFQSADSPDIYWLAAGHHRFQAHQRMQKDGADFEVHIGTHNDALVYGAMSNGRHGLPLNNADKRKAVKIVAGIKPSWSDRSIARKIGVTHPFVAKIRRPAPLPKVTRGPVETVTTPDTDYDNDTELRMGPPNPAQPDRVEPEPAEPQQRPSLDAHVCSFEEEESHADYLTRALKLVAQTLAGWRNFCQDDDERQEFLNLLLGEADALKLSMTDVADDVGQRPIKAL